jgi:acetyl-CoA acetyltransferase
MSEDVYILDAVRTPIGALRRAGRPAARRPRRDRGEGRRRPAATSTLAPSRRSLRRRQQAGEDNRNVARMAVLLAGLPVTIPGRP